MRIPITILTILTAAATTAWGGNISMQMVMPSPNMSVQSSTYLPASLPSGTCYTGTFRVGPDNIPRLCDGAGTWKYLPGVFRQEGAAISLSDPTSQSYNFFLGPYGGTADQGLTIPRNGGIVAHGTYGSDPALTTSGAGTKLIWYPRKAAFRAGQVSGGSWDNSKIGEYSVAFGTDNEAVGPACAVLSGSGNQAGRDDLGEFTRLLLSANVVAGGALNRAIGIKAFVGGGHNNLAQGGWSAVGGGVYNQATGDLSFIGGGGDQTEATTNVASAFASTIVGGQANLASGNTATIGGGSRNTASGASSTVKGGDSNSATGQTATIGGGFNNIASAATGASTVGGGANNQATGQASFVGGGNTNIATGINASVAGGTNNTSGGGNAAVLGGAQNTTNGIESIAGGYYMNAGNNYVIAMGHAASELSAVQADSIILHPLGNMGINTLTPQHKLDVSGTARFSGNLLSNGLIGIGVAAPSDSVHVNDGVIKLEPMNGPPAAVDGVFYINSSGAVCIHANGSWYDLLAGAAGGSCN